MNPNDKIVRTIGDIRAVYGQSGNFIKVLEDLTKCGEGINWALCGAMAMGFYGFVRSTEDIDILVESEEELEKLKWQGRSLFKSGRAHAMIHKETQIEIEILTPEFMKKEINSEFFKKSLETKDIKKIGNAMVPVVSYDFLVGLKAGRAVRPIGENIKENIKTEQDMLDIKRLMVERKGDLDLSLLEGLPEKERAMLEKLRNELKSIKSFSRKPKR